jgi:hypothetical protein
MYLFPNSHSSKKTDELMQNELCNTLLPTFFCNNQMRMF